MNYKWLMVISITLMVLSLAAVSASELDQTTLHYSYFDDDLVVDDLDTDSCSGESLNIDDNVPVSPSDISIDDDVDGSSAEADDGSAEDMDDAAEADEDGSADDDENDDSGDSDITDGDSIIRNMTNDTPNSNFNDEPISNIDGPGSFSELQSLIDQVPEGTVLYLGRDYMGVFGSSLIINKNIVIDGQGHTIDCLGNGRAIYSISGNVVLRNLNFINGHYENSESDGLSNGGAIWIGGTAVYTLDNCKFINCWVKGYGGAVFNDAENMLTILNCVFQSNTAEEGYGGAVYTAGTAYVENSTFENNHAKGPSGAIELGRYRHEDWLSKIISSVFKSNTGSIGGAVSSLHNLFIDYSTFDSNIAEGDGGAVYSAFNIIAQNSIFTSNSAITYGGAIFNYGNLSVTNCTFNSNKVDQYLAYDAEGGAIASISGDIYIANCTFDSNIADDWGGAVYAGQNVYINYFQNDNEAYNTFFNGNIADDNEGGAIKVHGNIYVKNTVFTSNKAYTDGGAIYSFLDQYITHCLFDSNRCEGAPSECEGGAIYSRCKVFIIDSIFRNNYAEDNGGAIYCEGDVNVQGSIFDSNSAVNYGGAIYGEAEVHADNSRFDSHSVKDKGGAIYAEGDVYTGGSRYYSNSAGDDGGAIFTKGCAIIEGSSFDSNSAGDYGGAIYAYLVKINNFGTAKSTFVNNRALDDNGGAIYALNFVSAYNAVFNSNTAYVDGGAIFAKERVDIKNCTFDSNRAAGAKVAKCYGGAIRTVYTDVYNSVFRGNYAENHGGAIYTNYFSSEVKYCTFYDNKAEEDGGAIYINSNQDNVVDVFSQCQFVANHAGDEGGAIYLDSGDALLSLVNNIIIANTAKDGHVVFNKGYYKVINNNWWGDIIPSKDNGLLVQWHAILPNENHVDSDPLRLALVLDKAVVSPGETVSAMAYFINSNGIKFTGEMPIGDIDIFTQGFKILDRASNGYEVRVNFVADKAGIYCIYANLHGQIYPAVLMVLDSASLNSFKDSGISNVNANAKSTIAKNAMAKVHSSNGPNIFAYRNGGLKAISNVFNMGTVQGQFVDASIINHGIFNPIVKSIDVPQSNVDFDIFAVLMSILSIFGL